METKELIAQHFGCLRQWLNEDRITEPSKMVTNEDLKYWLEPIISHLATLEKRAEKMTEALGLILPMAKGWAHEHPVGGNKVIVEEVEAAYRNAVKD